MLLLLGAATLLASSAPAYADGTRAAGGSGAGSGWVILAVIAVIVVFLAIAFLIYRRRILAKDLAMAREKVMPYYTRLAQEILGFDPQGDSTALGSLADAAAKYSSAGEQIEAADAVHEWSLARTTVLEGLVAMRQARTSLSLPEGDPIPEIAPPSYDQLTEPRAITVQGATVQGYPEYRPGSSYYYGGGYGIPGGWYATPFWQQMFIGMFAGQSGQRPGGVSGRGFYGRGPGPDGDGSGQGGGASSGGWSSAGGTAGGWSASNGGGGWQASGGPGGWGAGGGR